MHRQYREWFEDDGCLVDLGDLVAADDGAASLETVEAAFGDAVPLVYLPVEGRGELVQAAAPGPATCSVEPCRHAVSDVPSAQSTAYRPGAMALAANGEPHDGISVPPGDSRAERMHQEVAGQVNLAGPASAGPAGTKPFSRSPAACGWACMTWRRLVPATQSHRSHRSLPARQGLTQDPARSDVSSHTISLRSVWLSSPLLPRGGPG